MVTEPPIPGATPHPAARGRRVRAALAATMIGLAAMAVAPGCNKAAAGPQKRAKSIQPGGAKVQGMYVGEFFTADDTIPLKIIFQKDDLHGLTIDDKQRLVDGEAKFRNHEIKGQIGDRALQVLKFAVPEDQVLIQVVVDGRNKKWGFLSDAAYGMDLAQGPVLADADGLVYAPYGYVYRTERETWVILRPDAPIAKVSDMPVLSPSKPDEKLVLLFRVGKDQKLKYFAVGDKALLTLDPPFRTPKR